jgi:hypothetical protein
MKKQMVLLLIVSILAASGNLMAQTRKKGEVFLAGGVLFSDGGYAPAGGISIGYTTKYIGAEVNGAYIGGGGVFGANLVAGLFDNKRIVPYATAGAWTTTFGGLGFYLGGGVKMKASQRYALRIEYRRYILGDSDWGINAIVAGVSWFF